MFRHNLIFAFFLCLAPLSAVAQPDFLVDSEWLEEHVDDENLVILDVQYYPHRYFSIGHIPGAQQVLRFVDLGDNFGDPIMRFPPQSQFQASLRAWGINDNSTVVIYDDSRMALAARTYWLMELYGFDMTHVKILNGGLTAWRAFNDLENEAPNTAQGNVTLSSANADMSVEWPEVYRRAVAQPDPSFALIDARPTKHYTGEVAVHATRGGHIPGAINIVSLDGLDRETQEWLPDGDLAALYAGVSKDQDIFVYSHDGFRMSLTYLQLRYLGYTNLWLYNGGWMHWGNALALPVVKGTEPYDKSFDL